MNKPKRQRPVRAMHFPKADKAAIWVGIILTILVVMFFVWKITGTVLKDQSLSAVSFSTPTPPLKPSEN